MKFNGSQEKNLILEMRNITKKFVGVTALQDVNFTIVNGDIHALVGENGAGKSTLVRIISGIIQKSSGQIYINGQEVKEINPYIAQKKYGIYVVEQTMSFFPNLTVAENMFAGELFLNLGFVDYKKINIETKKLFYNFNLDISPTRTMEELGFIYQKLVMIVKALKGKSRILILDEPTASLNRQEKELLFEYIRDFNNRGISIVYISHHIEEIFEICKSVTILKDGRVVGNGDVSEMSKNEIVELMVGRKIIDFVKRSQTLYNENILQLRGFLSKRRQDGISFDVKKGEILAIVGIKGSGKEELIKDIFGITKKMTGKLYVNGKKIKTRSPEICLREGICLLPEDRRAEYLFLIMSLKENISYGSRSKIINKLGFIDFKKEISTSKKYVEEFNIKTPSLNQEVRLLSGGNQQKVALSKAVSADPKVLILHEPTAGIDVGSRLEIHCLIEELSQQGIAVIIISSDIDEVVKLSNRILTIFNRKIINEIKRKDKRFNTKDITLRMEGSKL